MECENVRFERGGVAVSIIDQTALPNEEVRLTLETAEECRSAIERLAVRGAPAIGIFAAFSFAMLARQTAASTGARGWELPVGDGFVHDMACLHDYLAESRPTAINLRWALDRMMGVVRIHSGEPRFDMLSALRAEAIAIQEEDAASCRAMAELGLGLIEDGWGLITHCNAGPLATSRYGTSLGPMLLGRERGMSFHVFADETRPLLQGARLTSYELDKAGVDVTLICDNMASIVMSQGWVQACFVGCDRVAANGDVANKIGTSGLAIIAEHYGVPFYVMCPTSTIDMGCATGADIPIEERDPDEIKTMFYERPMAPENVRCYNPAFDVTDHSLVTAIVTERGICRPPYEKSIAEALAEK
ncbi:S-methyl-5-thioribose-1-phosphate isomerase [Curtanaerobium respiraculi]|uniref:S-methyl-5-thioribose-1-phosphate isomerase n=1 Tax=Curtanaerobium respiraculi TaxID=2949669 RepID=UPI0024B3564F|nr:S-methyl-5-thioribose-1-phosphate isomerase [Curtanaerobium respiraculi]